MVLDWCFDDGAGLLGINLFYKDIANEIFRSVTSGPGVFNGQETTITVTTPINNGRDASVKGLELQAVTNLDMLLPGLGFSANATFLDTQFEVLMTNNLDQFVELRTMVGQPETSYNAALFFDGERFSAKLAYNYQDIKKRRGIRTQVEMHFSATVMKIRRQASTLKRVIVSLIICRLRSISGI